LLSEVLGLLLHAARLRSRVVLKFKVLSKVFCDDSAYRGIVVLIKLFDCSVPLAVLGVIVYHY